MIVKDDLRKIVVSQMAEVKAMATGVKRAVLREIDMVAPHVIILSGIRRCGKSTLLKQIMRSVKEFYYLNFEDQRLFSFEVSDFDKLDEVFHEEFGAGGVYFFDEIQNVVGWERFVRMLHDNGKKVILTGSNASLLSKELGTKLTGRHLTYEIFPFSYGEMLSLTSQKAQLESFETYLRNGGFPDFLKFGNNEILRELFNDVISRDVIGRYNLEDPEIVKGTALYLMNNVGKEFSYNKLAKYFNAGSVNTISAYVSYLEDAYLLFTVRKFDYSYKKQIINPKKVYAIDCGLSRINSLSFSDDKGRVFENAVFLHLRRKSNDIYYFKGKGECDFVYKEKGVFKAVQVCCELTQDNVLREITGLKECTAVLKIKDGLIITLKQEDKIDGVMVKPALKWFME